MDKNDRSRNITKKLRTSLILLFLTCHAAYAEYRAYQYLITDKYTKENYLVVSSHDPVSYISYHGGNESIELEMLSTWICLGYTGKRKDICASPMQKVVTLEGVQ